MTREDRSLRQVTRPDGSERREVLRYSQPFSLRLQAGYTAGLYLTSEPPTAYCVPANQARQQAVQVIQHSVRVCVCACVYIR